MSSIRAARGENSSPPKPSYSNHRQEYGTPYGSAGVNGNRFQEEQNYGNKRNSYGTPSYENNPPPRRSMPKAGYINVRKDLLIFIVSLHVYSKVKISDGYFKF